MNDLDEFAEIALGIFVALSLLIWILTSLERTLIEPAREKRPRMGSRERKHRRSAAPPDDDRLG